MGGIEMGVIEMGPGMAAVAIVFLSLAAKLYMSFGVRVKQSGNGYEPLEALQDNASKAQLNVAEYEGIFTAIFLFLYIKKADGLLVTIVSIGAPLTQALYFWGRVATGDPYPFSAIGALPRFVCMGMMIYILWNEIGDKSLGPGLAALKLLILSLAAKLFMSFGIRVAKVEGEKKENASSAQLNVAEYEGIFTAIFLFLYLKKADGLLVMIVSIGVPLTQALYFWGRVATGSPMPFSPIGALPRYVCMGISVYILYNEIGNMSVGPGLAAVAVLFLSLAAKLFMSFGIRVANVEGEKKQNASKAQLNVAEYEGLFTAALLFLHVQKDAGTLVTIVSIGLPLTQAIYFWGRVATGSPMPFSPIGALPRYACMGILAYQLLTAVN
eukprot:TRINITY_DN1012_c0_g1_i5.p1 TRINITY_DN1012_c0_g1~~TRINITY_DN1012_c0_g1_i5.p1  ORF type:complete len:383 (-),score=72.74 TRINITY_DN1012_c0_g1_i5:189-1337(-)